MSSICAASLCPTHRRSCSCASASAMRARCSPLSIPTRVNCCWPWLLCVVVAVRCWDVVCARLDVAGYVDADVSFVSEMCELAHVASGGGGAVSSAYALPSAKCVVVVVAVSSPQDGELVVGHGNEAGGVSLCGAVEGYRAISVKAMHTRTSIGCVCIVQPHRQSTNRPKSMS